MDVEAVAHTILLIESNGAQNALGDSGRALGPFQFHPEAFWEWADRPTRGMTWNQWFHQAIERFIENMIQAYPDIKPREIAVVFHRHCYIRRAAAEDYTLDDYAARFDKEWARL